MFQAFVDDSRQDPVFVLAGYIAPAERWALFSDKWDEVLHMQPRLEYLKVSEIYGRMEPTARDHKLQALDAVVSEFVSGSFCIAFNPQNLKDAFAPLIKEKLLHKMEANPFVFASTMLQITIARERAGFGADGPIEFIFDEQMHEKAAVIEGWDFAWKNAKPDPPNLQEIIGGTPRFGNDKCERPLQAADKLAWWMRRRFYIQAAKGNPNPPPPWPVDVAKHDYPSIVIQYNRAQLMEIAARNRKLAIDLREGRR
jgi:hypothetical protein